MWASGCRAWPVTEISSMACQTHLLDTRAQAPSKMARELGWDRLFPRMAKAWETIGTLKPEFRGPGFRGGGNVLGGVHDSTANFMRYVAAGPRPLHAGFDRHVEHQLRPLDIGRRARPRARHQHQHGRAGPHRVLQPLLRRQGVRGRLARGSGGGGGPRLRGRARGARHDCHPLLHADERAGAGLARQGPRAGARRPRPRASAPRLRPSTARRWCRNSSMPSRRRTRSSSTGPSRRTRCCSPCWPSCARRRR